MPCDPGGCGRTARPACQLPPPGPLLPAGPRGLRLNRCPQGFPWTTVARLGDHRGPPACLLQGRQLPGVGPTAQLAPAAPVGSTPFSRQCRRVVPVAGLATHRGWGNISRGRGSGQSPEHSQAPRGLLPGPGACPWVLAGGGR